MFKISYLNLVEIEITEVEGGYEVYTETGGEGEEIIYETKEEVADRLQNIKYHYLYDYKEEGKPEDHPSYEEINDLIKEFSN